MKWIEFLKDWSAKHNIPYSQCLKNVECKEAYHKQKGGDHQPKENNKLLNFNEDTIHMPRDLANETPTLPKSRRTKKTIIESMPPDENDINPIQTIEQPSAPQEKVKSVRRRMKKVCDPI